MKRLVAGGVAPLVLILALVLPSVAAGARYLIITHDDFTGAIQPLADWRTYQGLSAQVVPLSAIPTYAPTPTALDIRNYLRTVWNSAPARPEYVLLVGDLSRIPVGQSDPCPSDNYYANLDGHYKADLAVGRLPCRTVEECQLMVCRTLNYEQTPDLTDTTWFRKGLVAIRFDDYGDTFGFYVRDIRFATDAMRGAGFRVDSLFWRDSADLGAGFHGQGPDSGPEIARAVTEGRSFVLFRGHGGGDGRYSGWSTPLNARPESTANDGRSPIVFGGCCNTVQIGDGSGVGEAWLREPSLAAPNALNGAVAYIGNSVGAMAGGIRSKVIQAFFKTVFADDNLTLGRAFYWAKDSLYRWMTTHPSPDSSRDSVLRYVEWSLLGDPALGIRNDVPRLADVSHPVTFPLGPFDLEVSVSRRLDGTPVKGALVGARKGQEIQACGFTDSTGRAVLNVRALTAGPCSLVVSGGNLLPAESYARATPVAHDVACAVLLAPPERLYWPAMSVTPACTLYNYGPEREAYRVRLTIGEPPIYDETVQVARHQPGRGRYVRFPAWLPRRGCWPVKCSTGLGVDVRSENDLIRSFVIVGRPAGPAVSGEARSPDDSRFTVAPNPTRGAMRVVFDALSCGPAQVRIFNAGGRAVFAARSSTGLVPIAALPAGFYVVRLTVQGRTEESKLVVLK